MIIPGMHSPAVKTVKTTMLTGISRPMTAKWPSTLSSATPASHLIGANSGTTIATESWLLSPVAQHLRVPLQYDVQRLIDNGNSAEASSNKAQIDSGAGEESGRDKGQIAAKSLLRRNRCTSQIKRAVVFQGQGQSMTRGTGIVEVRGDSSCSTGALLGGTSKSYVPKA